MTSSKSITRGQILVVGFFLFGLAGCKDLFDLFDGKDKYYPLEDKYKVTWKQGDTLTYVDALGASFQLVVAEIKFSQRVTSRKGSTGPYNYIDQQTVFYDSAFINPIPSLSINYIYSKQPDGYVLWGPTLNSNVASGIFLERITLNSRVYNSVYQFSGIPHSSNMITTWYYSYAYGFVAFELRNGQLFTLDIP